MSAVARIRGRTRTWNIPLLVLAILVAAAVFGSRPLISYRALSLGASTLEIGVIASAFALLALLASIPVGRLVDQRGERRVIAGGALVVVAGNAIAALAPSTAFLAISQAALGLGQLMVVVGSHAVLANRGDVAGRDQRIGTYTTAVSLGHSIGPGTAGVLADPRVTSDGGILFFVGAAVAALVACVLALRLPAGSAGSGYDGSSRVGRASIRRTLEKTTMRRAMIGSIAVLAGLDLLIAYLPVFGVERGLPPALIGMMLGVLGLSQMTARVFMGRLARRYGPARVLSAAIAIPAVLIPLLIATTVDVLLVGLMVLIGLALGLGQPMTLALVARSAEPGGQGLAMGLRLAGNRLGQLSIPIAVGATAGQLGASGILLSVGAILGASWLYLGWGIADDPGTPEQGPPAPVA